MNALTPNPNPVVTVQVSTILSPAPVNYQQTGALVSFGATTLAPNTQRLLTQFNDLKSFLQPVGAVTSAVLTTGVVTVTLTAALPSGIANGDIVPMSLTGFVPMAYNGLIQGTIVSPTSFTYPLAGTPGSVTTQGKYQLGSSSQLNAQAATYFRQGTGNGVYVLELGQQVNIAGEITALETWLNTNQLSFYGYLLPDYWGTTTNIPTVLALYEQFENPEAMTYFWTTIQPEAAGLIPTTAKCIVQLVEAPGVAAARAAAPPGNFAEFTMAAMFYAALSFKPTSVTPVSPMCFKFVYGVTPYPVTGNGPLLVGFKTNFVNYIQTGAEGGIAFTNVYQGVTADGMDYFNWWFTIDWVQINANIDLTNAIINGSNNPLAPLYYNQPGINVLQATLASTMQRAAGFGMVTGVVVQTEFTTPDLASAISSQTFTGQCDVNAVPFIWYSQQNPSDFGTGEYDGLSTLFIPARGFVHILVQVVATDIVTV